MSERKLINRWVLEPGTGKAIELLAGQILRIEQIDGGQCVDFNCFNLHDYKEFMHTGRTRTLHGINPTKGSFMWSAPPRERAMMYILEDTLGCNDMMFPRCSAHMYASLYGLPVHTNCHDIQSEAQREYGLTPDDVHDSFNLFMTTGVENGMPYITRQRAKAADHVELLALIDVLAVPNVCGSDVQKTSNFSIKPVRLSLYTAGATDLAAVPSLPPLMPSQRTPADFKVKHIKVERGNWCATRPMWRNSPTCRSSTATCRSTWTRRNMHCCAKSGAPSSTARMKAPPCATCSSAGGRRVTSASRAHADPQASLPAARRMRAKKRYQVRPSQRRGDCPAHLGPWGNGSMVKQRAISLP